MPLQRNVESLLRILVELLLVVGVLSGGDSDFVLDRVEDLHVELLEVAAGHPLLVGATRRARRVAGSLLDLLLDEQSSVLLLPRQRSEALEERAVRFLDPATGRRVAS